MARKMQKKSLKDNFQIIIVILIMFCVALTLIYRAFHGIDLTDEAYYFATAKRFYDGDMLFREDWNRGQIFGALMEPFYRIYVFFAGNNEGVILCARILYIVLGFYVSVLLYQVLSCHMKNNLGTLLATLCVFVYARANIITISYYNLGFLTFLLAILWWIKAENANDKRLYYILSGINFSVTVLCMPYMIVLFGILVIIGVYHKIKGEMRKSNQIFWFVMGIILSALTFLAYFWKMIPWERLPEYIFVVFSDPGLEQESVFSQFFSVVVYVITIFLKYMWPIYGLTFIISYLTGKRLVKNRIISKVFPWVLTLEFFIQSMYVRTYFEGGIVITFFLFALQMQIFHPECRLKLFEKYFVIPGMLFGCIWILGSNVDERVINMGFLLMDIWAISFLWEISKEYGRSIRIMLYSSACLMFLVLYVIRCFDIYRDGSREQLVYRITKGSMRGIYTEEDRGMIYENMVELLREKTNSENIVVVLGCNPWVYLDTSAFCGSYTTWEINGNETNIREYYQKLPEKVPDIILSVPKELEKYESWKYSSHGAGMHVGEQDVLEGVLSEIVLHERYECLEQGGCVLYKKRF